MHTATNLKDALYIKFCIVFMFNEGSSSVLTIHPIDTVENTVEMLCIVRFTMLHLRILYRASLSHTHRVPLLKSCLRVNK